MNEEPLQFPQPRAVDLIERTITSDFKKAGITIQQISLDILKKEFTVTTEKVPEEIISSIREYAQNYGFTIKFLNPG